jgi:hypothetical protein
LDFVDFYIQCKIIPKYQAVVRRKVIFDGYGELYFECALNLFIIFMVIYYQRKLIARHEKCPYWFLDEPCTYFWKTSF